MPTEAEITAAADAIASIAHDIADDGDIRRVATCALEAAERVRGWVPIEACSFDEGKGEVIKGVIETQLACNHSIPGRVTPPAILTCPTCSKTYDVRACPKCNLVTALPEGSCECPHYHGTTGAGYCPIFVDGMTREEQAKIGYNGGKPPEEI